MKTFLRLALIFSALAFFVSQGISADAPAPDDSVIKRKLMVTLMIWEDVEGQQPGTDRRKELLAEFLKKSREYLNLLPAGDKTAGPVCTLRVLAACELGSESEAKTAGLNMFETGMDKSSSKLALKALAYLDRKGWLVDPKQYEEQEKARMAYFGPMREWLGNTNLNSSYAIQDAILNRLVGTWRIVGPKKLAVLSGESKTAYIHEGELIMTRQDSGRITGSGTLRVGYTNFNSDTGQLEPIQWFWMKADKVDGFGFNNKDASSQDVVWFSLDGQSRFEEVTGGIKSSGAMAVFYLKDKEYGEAIKVWYTLKDFPAREVWLKKRDE